MKLQKRLKQTLAMTAVATTLFSAAPVFAKDYTGHWAEATINEWKDKGVIDGYEDGSFKPKEQVTRAELAKMLVEVFGLTTTEGAEKYTDVAGDAWYVNHVKLVSAAGLMKVTNGNFRPSEAATREEAAYAIATAYHLTGTSSNEFKDHTAISTEAVAAVEALVAGGYINGYPDGTFKPLGTITRVEVLTMIDKVTAELYNVKGTYTKDTQGNVVINTKDVILKDMIINGNLYLAEGIGEGDIVLENVTVTGDIIIEGGKKVSIKGKSKIKNIVTSQASNKTTEIVIAGTATVAGNITATSDTIIEGTDLKLNEVVVKGAEKVEIKGSVEAKKVTVDTKATVTVDKKVTVTEVTINKEAEGTKLAGKGTVDKFQVNADKVVYDKGLEIKDTVVGENVTVKPKPEGGSFGGGGGSVTPPVVDNNLNIYAITVNVAGKDPVDISVAEDKIDMVVDLKEGTATINGETFDTADTITGISAKANIKGNVKVTVPGATNIGYEMELEKDYDVLDLAHIMDVNVDAAKAIIGSLGLDADEKAEAIRIMDRAQDILGQLADPTVTGAELAEKAQVLKNKLNSPNVQAAYNKVASELAAFGGFSVNWNADGTITIKATVHATRDGYEVEKTRVQVTF